MATRPFIGHLPPTDHRTIDLHRLMQSRTRSGRVDQAGMRAEDGLPSPSSRGGAAEYGAHLPLVDLGSTPSLAGLKTYARAADALGYTYLCANDHLLFSRPWLDGPTALAAVIEESGSMQLATTVSLPVLRGPVPLAKTLGALDVLSAGRLLVAVGPGSSARDYEAVGVPFDERWRRFDEVLLALRALLRGDPDGVDGTFYRTHGVLLEPLPVRAGGPPVWVASWGSRAGLRRVAGSGDGWLASTYNTTPARFRAGLDDLSAFSTGRRAVRRVSQRAGHHMAVHHRESAQRITHDHRCAGPDAGPGC